MRERDRFIRQSMIKGILFIFSVGVFLYGNISSTRCWGAEAAPSVRMEVNPSKVWEGEPFQLQFHYKNIDSAAPPDVSYLENEFHVQYLGKVNQGQSQMTIIINGRKQETRSEKSFVHVFQLTPKSAGRIRIEPPKIEVEGKPLSIEPVEIRVTPPSDQELVQIEMSASETEVFPLNPITLRLTVRLHELPGRYQKVDPVLAIADRIAPAQLESPWVEDEKLPQGLLPEKKLDEWIMDYRNSSGGFVVNNIRFNDPFDFGFSLFENRRPSVLFLPQGKRVEKTDARGNKTGYWEYVFERTFRSEKVGELTFTPASIKGTFIQGKEASSLEPVEIFAISKPLTIRVQDVPEEGRPSDYIGAFGQFDWRADLTPTKARIGEAMTLTLTLSGTGSVLQVKPPQLDKIPNLASQFKIYPPTEEISEGKVVFTWSIRPLQEGKTAFPSIPISYFDVETKKYVQRKTDPIPITVEKAEVLSTQQTFNRSGNTYRAPAAQRTRSVEGIYANMPIHGDLTNERISLKDWGLSILTLFSISLISTLFVLIVKKGKIGLLRQRLENAHFSRLELKEGLSLLAQQDLHELMSASTHLRSAFLTPVADYFPKSIGTLSESEIASFLMKFTNRPDSEPLLARLGKMFAQLEQLRYGLDPSMAGELTQTIPDLFDQWLGFLAERPTRRLLKTIKMELKKKPGTRGHLPIILIFALGLSSFGLGCSHRPDPDAISQFEEAIRLFDQAEQMTFEKKKPEVDASTSKETEKATSIADRQQKETAELTRYEEARKAFDARRRALFEQSAAIYQGLLDRGIESGAILYNLGNAWYRAGEKGKALAAWRRAERYLPNDFYLQSNIELVAPSESRTTPFPEILFFWQNKISYPVKYQLAFWVGVLTLVGFLTLLGFSLMEGRTGTEANARSFAHRRRLVRQATVLFFALFLVISTSALYDWYRFDHLQPGLVQSDRAVPRKGNSQRYEPVYKEPLPALSSVQILESRGNWVRVRFSDGQEGWLLKSDLLIY